MEARNWVYPANIPRRSRLKGNLRDVLGAFVVFNSLRTNRNIALGLIYVDAKSVQITIVDLPGQSELVEKYEVTEAIRMSKHSLSTPRLMKQSVGHVRA